MPNFVNVNFGTPIPVTTKMENKLTHDLDTIEFCKEHNLDYVYVPDIYHIHPPFTSLLLEHDIKVYRIKKKGGNYCKIDLNPLSYKILFKHIPKEISLPKINNNELISIF